jgi:hypothetical protein
LNSNKKGEIELLRNHSIYYEKPKASLSTPSPLQVLSPATIAPLFVGHRYAKDQQRQKKGEIELLRNYSIYYEKPKASLSTPFKKS